MKDKTYNKIVSAMREAIRAQKEYFEGHKGELLGIRHTKKGIKVYRIGMKPIYVYGREKIASYMFRGVKEGLAAILGVNL